MIILTWKVDYWLIICTIKTYLYNIRYSGGALLFLPPHSYCCELEIHSQSQPLFLFGSCIPNRE